MKSQLIEKTVFASEQVEAVDTKTQNANALKELTDLELVWVGGGSADVILG